MLGGGINIWIAAVALLPRNDNIAPVPACAGMTIVETITFSVDSRTTFILESLKDNHSNCIISSALREQEYGNLQSEMDKQFEEQKKVGEYYYRFKNGESGSDVHSRMSIFLQYLFRRILSIDYNKWDNIIIVSHALTIKYFMMNFLNLPVKEFENMKQLGNAEFWVIEKNEKGKYKVKDDIFLEKKK